MPDPDDREFDRPLSPEEEARASRLSAADLQRIDECLLSHMTHQWHKVARVILHTMREIRDDFPGLPDVFYGLRIRRLAESGAIESAGNLNRMRYSEIRMPDPNQRDPQ
jgi:uncharacterized protein DUF3658